MFKKSFLMIALAAAGLSSCTVSEPDTADGAADKLRLSALTSYGVTLIKFDYDAMGRMVSLNMMNEEIYTFEYDGNSTKPSTITYQEFEEIDEDGLHTTMLTEEDVWGDITVNANGYITGYKSTETSYPYDVKYDNNSDKYYLVRHDPIVDIFTANFTYSADGHLTGSHDSDGESSTWTWEDGLLMTVNDPNDAFTTYEYSDVDNINGQWEPMLYSLGPMAVTGFFGKAPVKFVKKQTVLETGGYIDESQFAYTLLDNGLINMSKVYEDEETMTIKYVYEKK